jgi:hypothetical protein
MRRFSGIGTKVFVSFIDLVLSGPIVGVRYFTLDRVIATRYQERRAKEVELRLFEARQHEKNPIMRKLFFIPLF